MKKQWLFLVLSLISLTLIAVSSYRTSIEDTASAAVNFSLTRQAVEEVPASSGWTLISQEVLMTALEAPESTWTRVAGNHINTNPDRQLPDNPGQYYLAGVLIDGQQHLVDSAMPPIECLQVTTIEESRASFLPSNLAVN